MKRMFFVFAVVLCFASSAFAEPWRVFDNAGLFTNEEVETIEQSISDFQKNTNTDFVVLTMDDYFGKYTTDDIAKAFYDSNSFGFGRQANGIIYYFHVHNGIVYSNYGLRGEINNAFNDETSTIVTETCKQLFYDNQYKDAVLKLIELATEAFETYKKGAV